MLVKTAVLFFFSAYWLLTTINSDINAVSIEDLTVIWAFFAIAMVGQLALIGLFFLFRLRQPKRRELNLNLCISLCAVINILCLYLSFFPEVEALGQLSLIMVLALMLVVAYHFFASLTKGWWTNAVVAVAFALAAFQFLDFYRQIRPPPVDYVPNEAGKTASPEVRIVEFAHKPNIYLLSFDGLVSEAWAQEQFWLKSLPYQDYLREAGFMRFENAFSDGPRTRQALNRLLALDQEYYDGLIPADRHFDLYTGNAPSPLLQIFKANGYTTDTYYISTYMGTPKGPYVDGYNVVLDIFRFCFDRNHGLVGLFGFYGYCLFHNDESLLSHFARGDSTRQERMQGYNDFIIDRFSSRLDEGVPMLSIAHFITPGHTDPGYDHTNPDHFYSFRALYVSRAHREVVVAMKQVVEFIKQRDPQALIYIYSDHGAMLSYNYAHEDLDALPAETQKFIVQDLYGILAAIYLPEFCLDDFRDSPSFAEHHTNSKVVRYIIQCLAEGQDPFVNEPEYIFRPEPGNESGYAFRGNISPNYEDYLYE